MGCYGPMGFAIEIPAHHVGGPKNLWGIRGALWLIRGIGYDGQSAIN